MLTVGLQYHKVLDKKKLFCKCKFLNEKTLEKDEYWVQLDESRYRFGNTSLYCRFEKEESPPVLNLSILRKALRCVSNIPKIQMVKTLVFSRKRILDGSLISGYQRTAVLAHSGELELSSGKKVFIKRVYLEEDSCGKINNCYTVSRMGLPLLEVVTEAIPMSSKEVVECLKLLDSLLNYNLNTPSTNYARRQDINLSGPTGYRVEYKGVAKLSHIKKIMDLQSREPFVGDLKGTPTFFYDEVLNCRVLLRYTQKSERMSYESQVEPIPLKEIRVKNKNQKLLESLNFQLRAKVKSILKNARGLKYLRYLDKTYTLKTEDYWVLVALTAYYRGRVLWSRYTLYLKNELSFEGLKLNSEVKPMSVSQLKTAMKEMPLREFYKKMKIYFPRNFNPTA